MSEFRAAGEATPSSLDSSPSASKETSGNLILAEKDSNPGPFTHEAIKGQPLTVDRFELKNFWDSPTANMQESIKEVDQWVQEKAKERNLADKPASYDEIINGILEQIGKSDNEKPQATFERVAKAIQATKRLSEAKLPPILDVHSLTPDEYKKTRA
jgi:hypothetical protein